MVEQIEWAKGFHSILDEVFKKYHLKASDCARGSSFSESAVKRWLKGNRIPKPANLDELCEYIKTAMKKYDDIEKEQFLRGYIINILNDIDYDTCQRICNENIADTASLVTESLIQCAEFY